MRTPNRDQPHSIASTGHDCRPVLSVKPSDTRLPWLILELQRDDKESLIILKPLGFFEVEAVLGFVSGALVRIIFKFHDNMV